MKPLQIRLTDETGKVLRWIIWRVPRAINCLIGSNRVISGWQFEDHDGYVRFAEGNWLDLVAMVKATASNYGFMLMSDLS